jgi:cell division protein FtsB
MRRKLVRGIIIIIMVYLLISFVRDSLELGEIEKRLKRAADEVERLRTEKRELEEKKRWAESEDFLEEEARNKLGLGKEGETVVVLPEEEDGGAGVERELGVMKKEETEEKENWQRWADLFF